MKIEIIPLKGIIIDNKEINLGSTLNELKGKLGEPEIVGKRLYYFDADIAFDFNEKNKLEFIEFLGGISDKLKPVIYGKSAFETQIEELRNILSIHNQGDNKNNIEDDIFYNISTGLYQELTLEDINDIIEEAKNDGVYEEMKEEIESDIWMANHCSTIGIGIAGYYDNVN